MKRILSFLGLICFVTFGYSPFCFGNNKNVTNKQKEAHFRKDESYTKERLYDVDFNERFDLFYSNTYCYVVDLLNNKEIYSDNDFSYPYIENISYHIFNDSPTSDFKFFCSDGTYLWQPEYPEHHITMENARYGYGVSFNDVFERIYADEVPSDAVLIDNSMYFFNLEKNHSENPDNRCCLVAIQILAGYYDNFYDDDYVPEKWDCVSAEDVSDCNHWENWTESPGTGHMSNPNDSRMLDYLTDYTVNNVNSLVTTNGLTFYQQKNILDYYLFEQCVEYTLSYCEGNLNDYWTQYNKTKIKSGIDNNYPVIVNGGEHSAIAFGYDEDYVYVHTGLGFCAIVPWSLYTGWSLLYSPSSLYLIPSSTHAHSNNYYSGYRFYCSCGEEWDWQITSIPLLPIQNLPNSSPAYFYHYYTPDVMAIFSYCGVYKDSNNHLIMNGNSSLTISFTNYSLIGVALKGTFNNANGLLITSTFKIDFLTATDEVDYSYNAKKYSKLCNTSSCDYLALNCNSYIRQVRISIFRSGVLPLTSILDISRLVLIVI